MTTTVMRLFAGLAEAQHVIRPLVAQGLRREDITLIVNREATSVSELLAAAAWDVNVDVGPASRGEPAALLALGVLAAEVEPYAMVLDGGGTLVSVAAADPQADAVVALMERYATAALTAP
jgi:hypothetical protein